MQAVVDNPKITVICPQSLNTINNMDGFAQDLSQALVRSSTILLLNLEKVDLLDSAGLMILVSGLRQAQNLGKRLILTSVSPSLRIIFELTQLDTVLEIFDGETPFVGE